MSEAGHRASWRALDTGGGGKGREGTCRTPRLEGHGEGDGCREAAV